jgi:hypothetical protein
MRRLLVALLLFIGLNVTAQNTFTYAYRKIYSFDDDEKLTLIKEREYKNYKFTVSDDREVITLHSALEDVFDTYRVERRVTKEDGTLDVYTRNNKGVFYMFTFPNDGSLLLFFTSGDINYVYMFTNN